MKEPFNRNEAKKLIQAILSTGVVTLSRHAKEELNKDDLTLIDVSNILRAGKILEPPELESGTWRYRVHTARMAVVVAFVSASQLKIVTAWRKQR